MKGGVDFILIAGALLVFWASSAYNYSLVLAPEGVATISVSYWAFLGPALLWLGAVMLLWRIANLTLQHGRRPLARLIRPLTGRLAPQRRSERVQATPLPGPRHRPARTGNLPRRAPVGRWSAPRARETLARHHSTATRGSCR